MISHSQSQIIGDTLVVYVKETPQHHQFGVLDQNSRFHNQQTNAKKQQLKTVPFTETPLEWRYRGQGMFMTLQVVPFVPMCVFQF